MKTTYSHTFSNFWKISGTLHILDHFMKIRKCWEYFYVLPLLHWIALAVSPSMQLTTRMKSMDLLLKFVDTIKFLNSPHIIFRLWSSASCKLFTLIPTSTKLKIIILRQMLMLSANILKSPPKNVQSFQRIGCEFIQCVINKAWNQRNNLTSPCLYKPKFSNFQNIALKRFFPTNARLVKAFIRVM